MPHPLPKLLRRLLPLALTMAALAAQAAPMQLSVDATDLDRRVLQVRQRIPLDAGRPGPLVLHYARYLPGSHGPYGDVTRLAGLRIEAGGRPLAWRRTAADPFSFVVDAPVGATELSLSFQYLSPVRASSERASVTRGLLGVEWETVLLYPDGAPVHALRVQPRLRLPAGWQEASALRTADGRRAEADAQGWRQWAEVSLETLVDSPLFAAPHLQRIELDAPGTPRPVTLDLLADEPAALQASDAQLAAHRRLVQQADALFGAQRPWRHYDLMLALSDAFGGIGLEHHESSENALRADYFQDWDAAIRGRELLPHEFTHARNGKFRRPADLATPDYQAPMGTTLLWVYEGQTEFWGHVLAARAGLSTPEQARDRLAVVLANGLARSGRAWRPLQDTTLEPAIGPGHTHDWDDWQRGEDYYDEAQLMWLQADQAIRRASGDTRSLDDFARSFFSVPEAPRADGSPAPVTYGFDDVVAALDAVQPPDWRAFLRRHLDTPWDLNEALQDSGWRLAWRDAESRFQQHERGFAGAQGTERPQELAWSLGLRVLADGTLDQVLWRSPAFDAGLTNGMQLVAVDERAYKPERLAAAVQANTDGRHAIRLLVKDGELFRTVTLDWRGGLRYPALERVEGTPDRLGALYRPH